MNWKVLKIIFVSFRGDKLPSCFKNSDPAWVNQLKQKAGTWHWSRLVWAPPRRQAIRITRTFLQNSTHWGPACGGGLDWGCPVGLWCAQIPQQEGKPCLQPVMPAHIQKYLNSIINANRPPKRAGNLELEFHLVFWQLTWQMESELISCCFGGCCFWGKGSFYVPLQWQHFPWSIDKSHKSWETYWPTFIQQSQLHSHQHGVNLSLRWQVFCKRSWLAGHT